MARGHFEYDLDVIDVPVGDGTIAVSGIVAEVEWWEDEAGDIVLGPPDLFISRDKLPGMIPIDFKQDTLGAAIWLKVQSLLSSDYWQNEFLEKAESLAPMRDQFAEHRLGMRELM